MALSQSSESELKLDALNKLRSATDPVERLRLRCLARGVNGIRELGNAFRIMDNDGDRKLEYSEFVYGLSDFGLMIPKEEVVQLFSAFDRDGSGTIDFDEFLEELRPPLSARRKRLIEMAFVKLDHNADGKITIEDLKDVYNVKMHKKYLNGEWTVDQCLREFLNSFDTRNNADGMITKDEFYAYYTGVSASIDDDPYFDLMMRHAYQLGD